MIITPATVDDLDYIVERLSAAYQRINEAVGMQIYETKEILISKHIKKKLQDDHSTFDFFIARKQSYYGIIQILTEDNIGRIMILDGKNPEANKALLQHAIKHFKATGVSQIKSEQVPGSAAYKAIKALKFKTYLENMVKEI